MSWLPLGDYSTATLVLLACAAFLAALARGFSGFGAALIFVPFASALIGPRAATPVLLVLDAIASAGMIPGAWKIADRREIGVMAIGAFVGVPVGAALLVATDPLAIRWAIAALAALMLAMIVAQWRFRRRPPWQVAVGVGATAGLFGGVSQLSGPPVVAYWMSAASTPSALRANLVIYFAVSTCFTTVSYLVGGLLTAPVMTLALLGVPIYAVGVYIGSRMFSLASPDFFRRVCYALITVAVVISLPALDSVLR